MVLSGGELVRETDGGFTAAARWTAAVMVGCTEPATAALNTVTLRVDKGVKEKLKFFY
jgi:hypothetical protein